MDLGIAGRRAVVCAASKGLGRASAMALAAAGCDVLITARGAERLEATADEIRRATGATVTTLAGDVTTKEGRAAILAARPETDILVNNAGGPPPGNFRDWDEEAWARAIEANMVTPIMLMRAYVDGMAARGFGRVVNITSAAVKAPIPVLGLSNGARAGLTGFTAGLAREMAPKGVVINNLLPGTFATDRIEATLKAEAERTGISLEAARAAAVRQIPAGRLGDPQEFGEICAFLCSVQAAFLIGQNILVDGGKYPGTM
ncbi:SDR family oxidoreductase [Siculibacillus lacustris]|uniref:SDR family oxidoreductase n=1 Tax=Siculibacillus lacustris TaxID=1549641 RepID=A0A4Q9VNG5_9HYPH|nr:SDR family oxidoreductase [Siculibacillus lacustris]TBW37198.1 SDR family oxidoreductase [Siculibacillus lacustris]